jgi:hypothetical protein
VNFNAANTVQKVLVAPGQGALLELSPTIVGTDAERQFSFGKIDATAEGKLVVYGFRAGVRAVIDACVRTAETIRHFQGDPEAIDDFLAVLVDGSVISAKEARLGLASPKLSKLRAIGANAELLRREEILHHLDPGYTIIYQVVVLYNELQGDAETRFAQLADILRTERPLSREALSLRTELAKRAKRPPVEPLPASRSSADESEVVRIVDRPDEQFDLLLASLSSVSDPRKLSCDYGDRPPLALRVKGRIAPEAVAVVVAQLSDIPTIENKLLPRWGFDRIARVLLLRQPSQPDVSRAEVVVVAVREGWAEDQVGIDWLRDDEALDPIRLASRLMPDANSRLHLFASAQTDGWCSIVGDENWSNANV